jgi:hypothetical protein
MKIVKIVEALLRHGEFPMTMSGEVVFRKWEAGFDGFFRGEPRGHHAGAKQGVAGWDSAEKVSKWSV